MTRITNAAAAAKGSPFAPAANPHKLSAPDLLFTCNQACVALKLTRSQLYREMATGRLVFITLGPRSRRIALKDLETWIEDRRAESNGGRVA
jgi:excisionase family DNA binding protein